jgi:AcrR family transcriptional regulator
MRKLSRSTRHQRGKPKRAGRPAKHRRQPHDVETVTDAAVRVFNRYGYEASSMEDVARETGLTKSSLYYHVSGKEELLTRALARAPIAVMDEPEARNGTPLDRLRHVISRLASIALQHPRELELLQRIKGNTKAERQSLDRRRYIYRAVEGLMRDAISAGQIRSDIDAALLARLVLGMSDSISQWYRPNGEFAPRDVSGAMLEIVFAGIEPKTH